MSRRRIAFMSAVSTLAVSGALAASAQGAYHLMKISEVHEGGGTGDYVELQMTADAQNIVAGHYIQTFDNAGNPNQTFQFPANVPNGDNQHTVLISDTGGTGGAAPDFIVPVANLIPGPAASVCYIDTLPSQGIDCVAFGATAPPATNPSPVGTPFAFLGGGLAAGQSIHRSIAPGCATLLEDGDDTNQSATDFALGAPSPRANATAPTERPCVPCRNEPATLVGTSGDDTLTGTAEKDVVSALGGNDTVRGLGGNDVICGGDGKDKLVGGNGKDVLSGEGGKDKLLGGKGKDKLLGGRGKDKLLGGKGKDKLLGQGGKDVCKGGKGNDTAKKCEKEKSI